MPFHHPYNFLPALPRDAMPDGLGDGPPAGHHCWHDELWSGEITVTMTAVTPLLLMRERETVERHRHLEVATRLDTDGREAVDLAPTQVKGMLRTIYEAVTNSRLSVFAHDEVLGFRTPVREAAALTPAVVRPDGRVVLLGRLSAAQGSGSAAVTVPAWQRHPERPSTALLGDHAHGDEVDAVVEHCADTRGWKVVSLHEPGTAPAPPADRHAVRGRLHVTGPTIKGKFAERLFVTEVLPRSDAPATMTQATETELPRDRSAKLVEGLQRLISHQREIHTYAGGSEVWSDDKRPWEYRGADPGRTAWSRYLYDVADSGHEPPSWVGPDPTLPPPEGALFTCWADGDSPTQARRLRPVMVSRLAHDHTPAALLPLTLHPATALADLSPADRLFGWVRHRSGRASERPEPAAHRGQLRVVRVVGPPAGDAVEYLNPPLTIPPLAAPKPGRFYLTPEDPKRPTPQRGDLFDPRTQRLHGRKVYPHHRGLEAADLPTLRRKLAYLPPIDPETGQARDLQDSQNATLHSWVRPGARFTCTLQLADVHPMELGALLWLLDPQRAGRDGPARHRIGTGKPLGFGSVELAVTATRISTGAQIRDRLLMLEARPDTTDAGKLAARFEAAMTPQVLAAVRAALTGFPDNNRNPVSYPRMRTPRSPGYAWFVKNEGDGGARHWLPPVGKPLSEYDADLHGLT